MSADRKQDLKYPNIRRCIVIDANTWAWLGSHRDDYGCRSMSQFLGMLIDLEKVEKRYKARIKDICSRGNVATSKAG